MKKLYNNFRSRYVPALVFYLANHFFMKFPSYRLRHWFLRRACKIRIGDGTSINMGCFVTGSNIEIGDNTVINREVYLDGRAGVRIGNKVNVSHQVAIQSLTHNPQCPNFTCEVKPVVIDDYAWIGVRALLLPGVKVGEGAVIGAGAVVSKDIPPYAIAVGNPACVLNERNKNLKYVPYYFPLFDTDIQ